MMKIEMENIGGVRGKYQFTLKEGLNVIEAPNATGKTSIIHGIRTLFLSSDEFKDKRHFLNFVAKDGSVVAKVGDTIYEREIHEAGGNLFVTGEPLFGIGKGADVLAVAHRDNKLLDLISTGKSIKPILDNFSDAKYYEFASKILKWKQNAAITELGRYRDEYRKLEEFKKQLAKLQQQKELLLKKQKSIKEIPKATAEDTFKKQQQLRELTAEQTELKIEIQTLKSRLEFLKDEINEVRRLEKYYNEEIEKFNEKHPNIDKEIKAIDEKIQELTKQKSDLESDQKILRIMLDETQKNLTDATRLGVEECLAFKI